MKPNLVFRAPAVGLAVKACLPFSRSSKRPTGAAGSRECQVLPRNQTCGSKAVRHVAVRTTTEIDAPLEATDSGDKQFNWFETWWPVQYTYNLDTDRPNRIQLLGEHFAIWKTKKGEWVAMKDMCPHRLAPLSEGRVEEDGTLMCSYHGWRFNECGKCVKIPHADSEKSHAAACRNPRSSAQTYPCKDRGGILWIWPTGCSGAELEAAMEAPISVPDEYADFLEGRVRDGCLAGYTRVLPYDYETSVENLLDPSHLPFAHHGTFPGLLRDHGTPLNMKLSPSTVPNSIASVKYPGFVGSSCIDLVHGSLVLFGGTSPKPGMNSLAIMLLATPLEDGRARIFFDEILPGELAGNSTMPFLVTLARAFPALDHMSRNRVLDGDNVFLSVQDSNTRENGGEGWRPEKYFTPAAADTMVMRFRKWLSTAGGGGPFGPTRAQRRGNISRRELLDRYSQHTLECKECQKALSFVNGLMGALKVCIFSCLAVGAWMIVKAMHQTSVNKWQNVAVAATFAATYSFQRLLNKKILPLFYFVDYVHAEKN